MNPPVAVETLENVLVEYPSVPYVSATKARPTYSYDRTTSPFKVVVKGREISRGVEMVPMHARSHWGPKVMLLNPHPISEIRCRGNVRVRSHLWQQLAENLVSTLPEVPA